MRHRLPVAAALLIFIFTVPAFSQTCGTHCGTERWKVKTLTNTTVVNIGLDPVQKSINWLRTRTRSSPLPNTNQIRKDREDFIARFGVPPTGRFKELDDPVLVEVVGVGFFDRMYGQRGRALPSRIELHSVIRVRVLE